MVKTALVTGSSKGIGRAIAIKLGLEDYYTFVTYNSDEHGANETLKQIVQSGGQGEVINLDVTSAKSIDNLKKVISKHQHLDVLVNSAAIEIPKDFEDVSFDEYKKIISVKADGAFIITKTCLEFMKNIDASIVNISSDLGIKPDYNYPGYCVSTAIIDCLTKMWAVGLAKYGIRTNAVMPTMTKTPMWDQLGGEDETMWESFAKNNPLGRVSTANDIAEVVYMIVNDKTKYLNGNFIYVDGASRLK